jgi:hypothetical protein
MVTRSQGTFMSLAGGKLRTAVLQAVESEDELERLLLEGMDVRLFDVVELGLLNRVLFELLNWLEANGLTQRFLEMTRRERPNHKELLTGLDDLERGGPTTVEPGPTTAGRILGWVMLHR